MPSPGTERRLIQDGRLQASLRHPNIVAVLELVDVDDACGLILKYVDGPSLDRWLETNRPDLLVAEALFNDIMRAVEEAHNRGIVHRDLKPANVLLATSSGEHIAKVADFGLARSFNEGAGTRVGAAMGTLLYMAPEQVRDASAVDARADMFSLGCVLHELVTGAPPFQSADLIAYYDDIGRGAGGGGRGAWTLPSHRVPGLPKRIDDVVTACLAFDRDNRVQDRRELTTILSGVARPRPASLAPKRGYVALQALQSTLGDRRFLSVLRSSPSTRRAYPRPRSRWTAPTRMARPPRLPLLGRQYGP